MSVIKVAGSVAGQKRRFWQEHIERWSQSGLRQVDYCRANGLTTGSFRYWKKQLQKPEETVSFVRLQMPDNLPVTVEKRPFNLFTPNGYRIEVNDGFDPATLHRLIGVVKRL